MASNKKTQRKKNESHCYFGPFASAYHVNVTLDTFKKFFFENLLRSLNYLIGKDPAYNIKSKGAQLLVLEKFLRKTIKK